MSMNPVDTETQMTCPKCGKTISVDPRFVRWCEHCEWNLEPASDEVETTRARRRRERARQKGTRLFEELKRAPLTKPGLSATRVAAFAIAILIHAATLAILAFGVYVLLSNFPTFFGFVVGGLLILLAFLIRPRLGGVRSGTVILPPDGAPALYGLMSRIVREMGARPVDLVALDASFNAGHAQVGVSRKRVLWIGLTLWNALTDDQRVALLSHELAHQVNGDLAFGTVVGSALRTLDAWHRALRPGRWQPGGSGLFAFVEMLGQWLARALYRVLRKGVDLVFDLEVSLLFRSGQRAEYFADRVAARVASTRAMLECLDLSHLNNLCSLAVRYAAQRDEQDVWASERNFLRDFSAKEWERLRRLDAKRGTSVDATHPPTSLRAELLRSGPQEAGRVMVSAPESAAISEEMAGGFGLVGERILSRFAG